MKKCVDDSYAVLHIRLGDYLSDESLQNIGSLSKTFYISCLEYLGNLGHKIWIVSDGTQAEVEGILADSRTRYSFYESESDLQSLEFIGNAKVVAISNSTFSLWACYVTNKKHVIYPDIWFPARTNGNISNRRIDAAWTALDVNTGD